MTLSARLLRWYDRAGRALPWRETHNPYRILVSEIMLQQTQVQRVLVFYARWLEQFPDWKTLAQATNADVIRAWAGLGYNRRALMLRDIAKAVIDQGVPDSEEAWRTLKGIGPYTAAALSVFSLGQRAAPIDTNIRRVIARVFFGIPYPDLSKDEHLKKAMLTLMKTKRFQDIPQAIFDLATLVCTKAPNCTTCPLRANCKAAPRFLSGNIKIPRATIVKARENKHREKPFPDRIYRGRILSVVRIHPKGILVSEIGPLIDPSYDSTHDDAWVLRIIERLMRDQLVTQKKKRLFLFS